MEDRVLTSLPTSTVQGTLDDGSEHITLNSDGSFTCKYGSGVIFEDGGYWKSDMSAFEGNMVDAYEYDPMAAIILFCDAHLFKIL